MIEGIFFLIQLVVMLLLLLKVTRANMSDGGTDLGVFEYIEERTEQVREKPEGHPRA